MLQRRKDVAATKHFAGTNDDAEKGDGAASETMYLYIDSSGNTKGPVSFSYVTEWLLMTFHEYTMMKEANNHDTKDFMPLSSISIFAKPLAAARI
jgi:hypothetical protein